MFANVTLQDILATLQAPPPEMQAAPGFAELLQYSEADWSQWLQKLRQLDAEGQDLAALPADFLLLPDSGLDRAATEGMHFIQLQAGLPLSEAAPMDDGDMEQAPAMAMLAALLYQPEVDTHTATTSRAATEGETLPLPVVRPPERSRPASLASHAAPPPSLQAEQPLPAATPVVAAHSVQGPALGLMAGMVAPSTAQVLVGGPLPQHEQAGVDLPEPNQPSQVRAQWVQQPVQSPAAPSVPVQPHSPAFAQQMQQQVQFMLKQDMKQMELRLDPPELGSLKIHLKVDHGLTQVQIITATAEARELLDASQMRLREVLPAQQGQLQLDIRHQPQGQGQQLADQGRSASEWKQPDTGTVATEEETVRRWVEPRLPQGLVDTFV